MLTDKQKDALGILHVAFPNLWKKIAGDITPDQVTKKTQAAEIIGSIKSVVEKVSGGRWPWGYWTKQTVCAQALYETNGDVELAVELLTPGIGKIKALTFTKNQNGTRIPLSDAQQIEAMRKQIMALRGEVSQQMKKDGREEEGIKDENEKNYEQKRERKPHPWIQFVRKVRDFCATRRADGHELDEWGLRQAEYGALMLKAGVPIEALKYASTLHFPPEAKKSLGIQPYDVTNFRTEQREEGKHAALPYVLTVIDCGIPVALIGPKGTGKTTLASQIAEKMNKPFTMISMTSATSPSAFFGRPKIGGDGGVVESEFSKFCREGGVILLDEMDAADENLLLIANSAIANKKFYNQQTGQLIQVSDETVFVAGMNTMGLGAGRDYNSRNKLDAATLDRWSMGRVEIKLDERVEDAIFYGILNSDEDTPKLEEQKQEATTT